jgi:flavin reductase (DIM6/NTAB) family NADH-FMN oxidoreductase RutF
VAPAIELRSALSNSYLSQFPITMSDAPDFAAVLGRIPSGIFILTIRHGDQETGMLASWVMQAGFDPPMVSVAVKKGRYVAEWIEAGAAFALNVVAENDKQLLKHFGRGFEPGQAAFEGVAISRSDRQTPVLDAGLGFLECTAAGSVASGDHVVFLARVEAGKLGREDRPMVHIRKSGLNY